jgi:hypothetical protein
MNSLELGFRFLTSLEGSIFICVVIGLAGVAAYFRFSAQLRPLHRELKTLCDLLNSISSEEDFAARFEEVNERIRSSQLMGHQWTEFSETLIYPTIDDEKQVLYNSRNAVEFFSRENLLGERINLRMFNALPNLLTGAGILGTFIGLVAGIYLAGSNLADPTKAQEALSGLLGGASLAFLTSIVGLTASILFSVAEKHQIHRFEQLRQCWVGGLDRRLCRVTLESLNKLGLSESRRHTELLSGFTEQLAFQLAEALEQTVPKALDAQVTQPLTKTLEGLKASIDMMAENQAKTNEETLREIVERFSQSITGAAGQEMQEFSKAVQTMSGTLTDQIRAISEQQEAVRKQSQESVEQLASVFQRGAEDLQKRVAASVDEILEGLSTTVKEMSALLDGAAGRVAQQLDRTAAAFGSTVETLTSSVEGIRTILTTANQLMEYVDQLMAATRQALVSAEETGKKLEASARAIDAAAAKSSDSAMATEKSAAALTDAMAAFAASQHRVEQTWGEYQKRFEGLDESLGRAFGEIDSGLQNYARNVRDFTQELDQHTGAITSALTGAVEVLQDAIEDLTDALPQNRAPA